MERQRGRGGLGRKGRLYSLFRKSEKSDKVCSSFLPSHFVGSTMRETNSNKKSPNFKLASEILALSESRSFSPLLSFTSRNFLSLESIAQYQRWALTYRTSHRIHRMPGSRLLKLYKFRNSLESLPSLWQSTITSLASTRRSNLSVSPVIGFQHDQDDS